MCVNVQLSTEGLDCLPGVWSRPWFVVWYDMQVLMHSVES